MATWEDGPEYAPIERPSVFAAPTAVRPLDKAPVRAVPSAGAPRLEPRFDQRERLKPLAEHQPAPGPQRDPHEPYDVAASVMTEVDSAWNTVVHYHVQPDQWAPPTGPPAGGPPPPSLSPGVPAGPDPRAPIRVGGVLPPPPEPAGGFPSAGLGAHPGADFAPHPATHSAPHPATHSAPHQATHPATHPATQPESLPPGHAPQPPAPGLGEVFNAVTAPTFITLLIGGLAMSIPLFGWLSPLMFVLAFITSTRIAYRRHWVRLAFLVGAGALGTTIVVGLLFSPVDLLAYFQLVQAVSTVVCWLVLAAVVVVVWQALTANEQPTHPTPRRAAGWD